MLRRKIMIKIDFEQIDWQKITGNGRHGRAKTSKLPTKLIRLLELSPMWNERKWCTIGHTGYVLEGSLFLNLGKEGVEIAEGQAFAIESGEKHKAFCKSKTRIFLVSEAQIKS